MSNVITSQNIRLKTNYKIVEIEDIKIVNEINQHAKLYIKGIIEYDEGFLYNTTVDDILQVYIEGEEPIVLFTGIPSNIQVKYEKDVSYIEIFCESGTSLMDIDERSHSFQNKNMKYKELTTKINGNYNSADTICTLEKDLTLGEMQVQYKETDWEFLKRIATHEQSFLVADCESEFPKYWLGIPEQQSSKVKVLKDTKENVLREVLETKYEVSKYEYEVLLYEHFKIGDKIKINNDTLTITKCVVKLKDGILQFNYKIENLNYLKTKLLENRKVQGVSLVGKILDVALNQVKIHLDIDESQDKDTAHWFPYSAEANNVWYTMPHIGEKIRIYFPTMREAEAITMSSTRGSSGEIATNKTMNKPTEKYLDTKWGKQVALHEGDVDINTPLMSMVLDEENITLDSSQNIEITANEVLNLGRSVFTYKDSNGAVQTKIEETQSITIETEELCTVSVTSFSTVIELDEDNFMMPQDKVKMEGSVKDGFADISSQGQQSGEQAQQTVVVDVPETEVVEEEPPKKSKGKKFWGCLGAAVTLAVGVVAAVATCAAIGAAAPLIAFGLAIAFIAAGTTIATAQFQEAMSDTDENFLRDGMGEENYEALLNGYYLATSFAIMPGVTLYGALAGTTGYAIFGGEGRNDWRNYLKWASIGGMVSNTVYGCYQIFNLTRSVVGNIHKINIIKAATSTSLDESLINSSKTELNYITTSGVTLKGTQNKTTTILGTYSDDTANILGELGNYKTTDLGSREGGFNLLNTPDEFYQTPEQFWKEYNEPWLRNVIERKDIVIMATEPTKNTLYRTNKITGIEELTGFGREYMYLKKYGYIYDPNLKQMIPPK